MRRKLLIWRTPIKKVLD
ncbi:hypothetical protein SCA6_015378 [Theobroma cacao]